MPTSRKTSRRRRAGGAARAGTGARKPAARASRKAAAGRGAAARPGGPATKRKPSRRKPQAPAPARTSPQPPAGADGATDPDGYFVARVCGEEAVREAPHAMIEGASDTGARVAEGVPRAPEYDERLGELPWGYGDDAVVALPRDPCSAFVYWDPAEATLQRGFEGLDHPRAQLWVYALGDGGWERIRAVDVALESRGYYAHDLDPGRTYRAELHAVDGAGRDRLLGPRSNEISLPASGPSPVVDDRFLRLSWDQPLGGPLGPGHVRAGFPEESREALARLSAWSRDGSPVGSAGLGRRPTSPGAGGGTPRGGAR